MFSYPVAWTRFTWLTLLLLPLSLLFGLAVTLRRSLFRAGVLRSERLSAPVIIVGNTTVGGTGKTPLVIWLVDKLRAAGYTPGIISRGYGGSIAGPHAVMPTDNAADCGDEPVLIARCTGCPVWIGKDRVAVARALLATNPDCNVIVSDDGLQHYRLARDIEIAVVDGMRGLGNGWMLPAGPLREAASRLDTVDAVVVRGKAAQPLNVQSPQHAMTLEPAAMRNLLDTNLKVSASHFTNLNVHAVAGIGNPQQFFDTLTRMGIAHTPHAFADHHRFTVAEVTFNPCDAVLMTEKDAVKCERFATEKLWTLQVDACVDDALAQRLLRILQRINRKP